MSGASSVQNRGARVKLQAAPGPRHASQLADCPELDCLKGLLSPAALVEAAYRASELGIGADRVLIAQGVISEDAYVHRLSLRSGVRLMDFANVGRANIDLPDEHLRYAAQSGLLRVRLDGETVIVINPRQLTARHLATIAAASPREIRHLRLASEKALADFLLYRTDGITEIAIEDLRRKYSTLSAAPHPEQSRFRRWMRRQRARLGLAAVLAFAATFPTLSGNLLALAFLAAIGLRLAASLAPQAPVPARIRGDVGLPTYSIVVALYREAPSVPQLLAALDAMDYPREKLDIILVVETDDLATRAAIARERPAANVRVIVAPNEGPRTKPKALNVALPFARGTFVAVFDAEDRPDPDQLRIALGAFHEGGDDLVCVQARLAIENSGDSFFTRMFAAEYAAQFDIVMPGYDRFGLPWPLGGTSNHFRGIR